MDPKVASLVVQEVGNTLQDKDESLANQEPAETRIARFAQTLIDAELQRELAGNFKDPLPAILDAREQEAIQRVLFEVETASQYSADAAGSEEGFLANLKARIGWDSESRKDSEVFDSLTEILFSASKDDLGEGVAAPAEEFTTEDGRYVVTIGEDGSLRFRDIQTKNTYGHLEED